MKKINKLRAGLFFTGAILVIAGFVLHFYYGPVTLMYALIGAVFFFLGILLFLILIITAVIFKLKGGIKNKKLSKTTNHR